MAQLFHIARIITRLKDDSTQVDRGVHVGTRWHKSLRIRNAIMQAGSPEHRALKVQFIDSNNGGRQERKFREIKMGMLLMVWQFATILLLLIIRINCRLHLSVVGTQEWRQTKVFLECLHPRHNQPETTWRGATGPGPPGT